MALKPTIYKTRISLSDLDRNYYDTLNLTIAQHPSETLERMVTRIMAFCINAQPELVFTKGLSDVTEPDLWVRTMDDNTSLWVEVGEPEVERIKKSTRKANEVKVYSFNQKSNHWWEQNHTKFSFLDIDVVRFQYEQIQRLASLVERSIEWSLTITGQSAFVVSNTDSIDITWETLQQTSNVSD